MYRAAIIGLGFVGAGDRAAGERIGQNVDLLDGTHRDALTNNSRIRLVAGCDLDAARRGRFGSRGHRPKCGPARTYADWQQMLDREQLDLVSIATTAPSHAELTVACAQRGIRAVYCEKPIATCVEDAQRMLDACENSGTLLVVNHNRRFNPNYRDAQNRIANGELGELTSLYLRWGTGRLGCVGTHLIDAARMLTGREVTGVCGMLDESEKPDCRGPEFRDPGGWGLFRMKGGLTGLINAPNQATGPPALIVEGTLGRIVTGSRTVNVEWFDGRAEVWPPDEGTTTSMDQCVCEITAWLDGSRAERGGCKFPVSAVDAIRALEIIVGLHLSHAAGGTWIDLPLSGTGRQLHVKCA